MSLEKRAAELGITPEQLRDMDNVSYASPSEIDRIAAYIDGAIRVLYNSDKEKFNDIFGKEQGPYLWSKFVNDKNAAEGDFICYLDYPNQRKLAKAVVEYVRKNDPRAAT